MWLLIVTALGLPLFIWLERLKFEKWMADYPQLLSKPHRDQFELNAKHMETFWRAVAMYLTAGLFSFQLKSVPESAPEFEAKAKVPSAPTSTEFQQRTQAVTLLANAVSKNAGLIPVTNPGIQKSDARDRQKRLSRSNKIEKAGDRFCLQKRMRGHVCRLFEFPGS